MSISKKKILLAVTIIYIICIIVYWSYDLTESTLSPMFIIEKGIDKEGKIYFIGGGKSSDSNSQFTRIKILVKDKNIINLIVLNKAYLVDYSIHKNYNRLLYISYDQAFEEKYKNAIIEMDN